MDLEKERDLLIRKFDGYLTSHWIEHGDITKDQKKLEKAIIEAAVIGRLFRDTLIETGIRKPDADKMMIEQTKIIGEKLSKVRSEFFNYSDRYVLPSGSLFFDGYREHESYKRLKDVYFNESLTEAVLEK